jgi:hypothetical protein
MEFFKQGDTELNNKELTHIVHHLMKQNMDLENRLAKLEEREKKKERRNVTEHLKTKTGQLVSTWLETIDIQHGEFEGLVHHSYHNTIVKILKRLLSVKTDVLPFCAFTEKPTVVYMYDTKEEADAEWHSMSLEDVKRIVFKIDSEMNKYYFNWADRNKDNESLQELIVFYMGKIDCFTVLSETKLSQIKKCIRESTQISQRE